MPPQNFEKQKSEKYTNYSSVHFSIPTGILADAKMNSLSVFGLWFC